MSLGEKQSPSSPDDSSTLTFGSFSPEPPLADQHRLEVEKLLAVIARGRSAETRHLSQLEGQASELTNLRTELQHFQACHPQLYSDHQALLTQYHSLREDHAWLSSEHLNVFSEKQRQQGRLESLEHEAQQAKQQASAQSTEALETRLKAAEMASVELRIERAAVQTLQDKLFSSQQSEKDQQRRLESLETECATLRAASSQHQQERLECRNQISDLEVALKASQDHCSQLLSSLQELRAASKRWPAQDKAGTEYSEPNSTTVLMKDGLASSSFPSTHLRKKKPPFSRRSKGPPATQPSFDSPM